MFLFPKQENIFRSALILSGDSPSGPAAERLRNLAAQGVPMIAADGGADRLEELNIVPTAILGDGDSMRKSFPQTAKIAYPRAKNFTDGHAAMEYTLSHYPGSMAVFGGLGGRLDMLLHNLALPVFLPFDAERVQFFHDNLEAAYCHDSCKLRGNPGDGFSFLPITETVKGVKLTGFEYPLQNYGSRFGDSRGVSNVLQKSECDISLVQGTIFMIHYF